MSDVDDILAELDAEENIEETHADVVEAAEEKYDGEDDKITRKLEKKLGSLEQKFEKNALRTAIDHFTEKADDLEKELFAEVQADVNSLDDFERTSKFIRDRAAKLREREQKLLEEAEQRAQEKAAKTWGTGPIGAKSPPATDEEKEQLDRIRKGDTGAAFAAIVGSDFDFDRGR